MRKIYLADTAASLYGHVCRLRKTHMNGGSLCGQVYAMMPFPHGDIKGEELVMIPFEGSQASVRIELAPVPML